MDEYMGLKDEDAELICELRNNLTSLLDAAERVERQWIITEEQLPEVGSIVLLFTNEGHIESGWYQADGVWQLERTDPDDWPIQFNQRDGQVTHWMPLPAAPSVAEKEGE